MTAGEVRRGQRVRDRSTGRCGVVVSLGTIHLGLISVALDPCGYDASTVWLEIEDLERAIPDSERMR